MRTLNQKMIELRDIFVYIFAKIVIVLVNLIGHRTLFRSVTRWR